ncbi:MAG: isoamylase early set domain-containing protein [Saprospiraceae bacterium]|nr:isoamylase early set domain-containing protein [Saprospiraceae bacterium]
MSIIKNYQPSKGTCKVTFTYSLTPSSKVKTVQVLGDFNSWDAKKGPKMKASKTLLSTEIELKAGQKYEFRYLLDGLTWDNDHNADSYVPSPFGGISNSVIVLDAVKSEKTAPVKSAVSKTTKSVVAKPVVKSSAGAKKENKVVAPKAAESS